MANESESDRAPHTEARKLLGLARAASEPVEGAPGARPVELREATADASQGRSGRGTDEDLRALYVISVAAELAGVHPQTLRIYERRGLVGPSRTGGGSRRYSPADIARLRHIGDLTASGLNLEGVRRVLELEAQLEQLRADLEHMRVEAREAIERTHRKYRREIVPLRQSTVLWRRQQRPSAAPNRTRDAAGAADGGD